MEQTLIESGFQTMPADTAEKVARLQTLPPYKLVKRKSNGQDVYVYADPTKCQCAYVGNAENYARFKRYMSQLNVADIEAIDTPMAIEEQAETLGGE